MARVFTKNMSNYLSLPNAGIGSLLNGKSVASFHLWATANSFDSATNENRLVEVSIGTSYLAGVLICVTRPSSQYYLRVGSRSQFFDSFQARNATTQLSTGVLYSFGAVIDWQNKIISPYVNGNKENGGSVSFGANTFTLSSSEGADSIGGAINPPPISPSSQWNGRISEVAIWRSNIGDAGFYQLSKGASPLLVEPRNLIFYTPFIEKQTTEKDLISLKTINYTNISPGEHCRIYMAS